MSFRSYHSSSSKSVLTTIKAFIFLDLALRSRGPADLINGQIQTPTAIKIIKAISLYESNCGIQSTPATNSRNSRKTNIAKLPKIRRAAHLFLLRLDVSLLYRMPGGSLGQSLLPVNFTPTLVTSLARTLIKNSFSFDYCWSGHPYSMDPMLIALVFRLEAFVFLLSVWVQTSPQLPHHCSLPCPPPLPQLQCCHDHESRCTVWPT